MTNTQPNAPASLPVENAQSAKAKLAARDNAIRASGIGEGRKLERAQAAAEMAATLANHAAHVEGVRKAQADELQRHKVLIGKAARSHGRIEGIFAGALLVAILCAGVFFMLKDVVILNTATQRVSYPRPPELVDTYTPEPYTRNPREPANAN